MTDEADERGALHRLLFDRATRPMWTVERATGRIRSANDMAVADYGYSRDDLVARTLADLQAEAMPDLLERLAAGASRTFATRQRKKDGSVIEVLLRGETFAVGDREMLLVVAEDLAERRSVDALRESERRFRALVEHGSDGVALYRIDGTTVYVSPAVTQVLGFAREEMIEKHGARRSHPDDIARIRAEFEALSSTAGEQRIFETRAQHRDGSWRWIESVVTNHVDEPDLQGIVSNFRDVTARRNAEEALRETRARLEFLMTATSAVTYTCKPDGDHAATFISDNVITVLGYEPSDFLESASFWAERIHPEDRPRVLASISLVHALGRYTHEYRFRAKDGTYRWMQDEQTLVRDESGENKELIGYWIDVTARKDAEAALRRSEENFRTLAEHLPSGIMVHRDGRVLYVNPALVALLGYESATEIIGRPPIELAHPDSRADVRARMERTRTIGREPPNEVRVLRRDGSAMTVEMEGLRLAYDGAPANVVIARDLTERREIVARLALTDRMLSVGTLAAGVAHEINNPLAYVIANLDLLSRELPSLLGVPRDPAHASRLRPEDVSELLRDAREGAARMRAVVSDLRALSRADDMRSHPVDLRAVIASSLKMAGNEIRHRARLVLELGEVPPVFGNDSRLGQVFLNLLLNAAQSIPDGHADENEIRVRLRRHGEDRVCAEVEDTGCRIPSEIVGHIFDPFFTTKPMGVGTGLGLSICHGIVQSLGGSISVESTVGVGSTFRVVLVATTDSTSVEQAGPAPTSSRRGRILVIDDEPAIGKSMTFLLAPEHDVVALTRAAEALARIEAGEHFDVVLCDLMMPEMSGVDFYSSLVQRAPRYIERIVFLTGGAFTASTRAFLESVQAPRLAKPFDGDELRSALRRAMSV